LRKGKVWTRQLAYKERIHREEQQMVSSHLTALILEYPTSLAICLTELLDPLDLIRFGQSSKTIHQSLLENDYVYSLLRSLGDGTYVEKKFRPIVKKNILVGDLFKIPTEAVYRFLLKREDPRFIASLGYYFYENMEDQPHEGIMGYEDVWELVKDFSIEKLESLVNERVSQMADGADCFFQYGFLFDHIKNVLGGFITYIEHTPEVYKIVSPHVDADHPSVSLLRERCEIAKTDKNALKILAVDLPKRCKKFPTTSRFEQHHQYIVQVLPHVKPFHRVWKDYVWCQQGNRSEMNLRDSTNAKSERKKYFDRVKDGMHELMENQASKDHPELFHETFKAICWEFETDEFLTPCFYPEFEDAIEEAPAGTSKCWCFKVFAEIMVNVDEDHSVLEPEVDQDGFDDTRKRTLEHVMMMCSYLPDRSFQKNLVRRHFKRICEKYLNKFVFRLLLFIVLSLISSLSSMSGTER
jgi:hypothetical protein